MSLQEVSSSKSFGGYQKVYSHQSQTVKCVMRFSIYVPPNAETGEKVPVLYWLAGISSNEETFMVRSGFQKYAAQYKLCVVCPDTGPRSVGIDTDQDQWDFGTGAGFYVDATEEKWLKHYQMYSYVNKELPDLIERSFPFVNTDKRSICGYSMGGHGALICAFKNPGRYMACTVLAPVANPTKTRFARQAFMRYLGDNEDAWKAWDATYLVSKYSGPPLHLLVDQGTQDAYLDGLLPNNFVEACKKSLVPVVYREQEGYDHSYFFVATFIEDHLRHHSQILYS